jgi:hypothetical protein
VTDELLGDTKPLEKSPKNSIIEEPLSSKKNAMEENKTDAMDL